MSLHSEALRAVGGARDWYARQSQMTVFGSVPTLQDVHQNFSDSLARAVGISPPSPSHNPNPKSAGRRLLSSEAQP